MICKNCGHEIKDSPEYLMGEKGIAHFYYHSDAPFVNRGCLHADFCNCTNPEPNTK